MKEVIALNPEVADLAIHARRDSSIGRILLELGKLTPQDAERVLHMQQELGLRFGEAALRMGLITESDIQQVLARQFDYPYLEAGQGGFPPELVAAYQPFCAQVETLRAIRSQLMLRWFAAGHKTLAIASVNPGDGCSIFAANLAVVFSQLGEQTLLVDANLRTPRQHQIFNLQSHLGLADILGARAGLETLQKINAFLNLSILPSGTPVPNPQEMLGRSTLGSVNTIFSSRFDVVLYDVPAFSTGADALAVAARAGGVILVARRNVTRSADLAQFALQLRNSGADVLGSILLNF